MMIWALKRNITPEHLGLIPSFLDEDDPRPAREQFDAKYIGGWMPFPGFEMLEGGDLKYPEDPVTICLAETKLRDETIRFYQSSWVSITQPDGSFEVSRMD